MRTIEERKGIMGRRRLMAGAVGAIGAFAAMASTGSMAWAQATGPQGGARAGAGVVNVYSARHYDSDQQLFDRFTAATGIRVNVVEGEASQLIERLRAEGRNSPADVLITVDAGRLWRAQDAGVLQPLRSAALEAVVPAHLRDPAGHWFGMSTRARVLVYAKDRVQPNELSTYEGLADPKWKGRLLVRSSTHVYNQSLVGALLAAHPEAEIERWARGIVANLARPPQGGDTDQIKAVAAGEGDVAIVNHYYLARLMASDAPADKAVAGKVAVVFPNQDNRGTHVNISGAGLTANAPNRDNGVKLIEFMAGEEAQRLFAIGNFEYPVRTGVSVHPVVAEWGPYKQDQLSALEFGRNNPQALRLMDRAGWR